MNNKEKGDFGEVIARKYLEDKGIHIIALNYRIKTGEIDIISSLDDEIIFVEVKSRNNVRYGYPAEAVNYKKIKKILNTANYYISQNNLHDKKVRFDVIEVYLNEKKINHVENAF
ncbi:YraN family protein [Romboutsia lituseburensis]|uniref:YraN family protein n=1 Tax=Romboutsia lituseburensis TaxID=1537 RepID=UPI00215A2E12|nr:YraN family protein [Romboutsia lituseburensis]MCR8745174.1 YraN family protein [Romboutsia lituseburensis]